MNIALIFITHDGIASNLLHIGEAIIKKKNTNIAFTEVPMDADTQLITTAIENNISTLDTNDGIVFITDIYGGTPSNIAQSLAIRYNADLLCGVNLPMVIRLLNYRHETKSILIQKALDGACKSIQKIT